MRSSWNRMRQCPPLSHHMIRLRTSVLSFFTEKPKRFLLLTMFPAKSSRMLGTWTIWKTAGHLGREIGTPFGIATLAHLATYCLFPTNAWVENFSSSFYFLASSVVMFCIMARPAKPFHNKWPRVVYVMSKSFSLLDTPQTVRIFYEFPISNKIPYLSSCFQFHIDGIKHA
jgi:hypothetical protein